jgi:hypothetical protein
MTGDETDKATDSVAEKPCQEWPLTISSFTDVVKYSAIAGAIIYAGLFLGYRKYYSQLGIRPEDVGVDNTYILARSIGFIVLAAAATGVAIVMTSWFHVVLRERPWTRRHVVHILFVAAIWAVVYVCLLKFDAPQSLLAGTMGAVLTLSCIAMAQFSHGSPRDRAVAVTGLAVAAITIFLVPVLAAIISAYIRSDLVLKNARESTPVTILGIPLLDVSAKKVQVSWICDVSKRPPVFRGAPDSPLNAILVGETGSGYYLRVLDPPTPVLMVKIPEACAFVSDDETT